MCVFGLGCLSVVGEGVGGGCLFVCECGEGERERKEDGMRRDERSRDGKGGEKKRKGEMEKKRREMEKKRKREMKDEM